MVHTHIIHYQDAVSNDTAGSASWVTFYLPHCSLLPCDKVNLYCPAFKSQCSCWWTVIFILNVHACTWFRQQSFFIHEGLHLTGRGQSIWMIKVKNECSHTSPLSACPRGMKDNLAFSLSYSFQYSQLNNHCIRTVTKVWQLCHIISKLVLFYYYYYYYYTINLMCKYTRECTRNERLYYSQFIRPVSHTTVIWLV
jgi:hypothetical protein